MEYMLECEQANTLFPKYFVTIPIYGTYCIFLPEVETLFVHLFS